MRAVLRRLNQMNCNRIICCGDIIGIGPYPEEIENGNAEIETIDVLYNVDEVIQQIDMINYPEADIIKKIFYGQ